MSILIRPVRKFKQRPRGRFGGGRHGPSPIFPMEEGNQAPGSHPQSAGYSRKSLFYNTLTENPENLGHSLPEGP